MFQSRKRKTKKKKPNFNNCKELCYYFSLGLNLSETDLGWGKKLEFVPNAKTSMLLQWRPLSLVSACLCNTCTGDECAACWS